MACPVNNVTRRGDRASVYWGFAHSIGPESLEHRWNRSHSTELAGVLRLAVGGGLSRWPFDRQRWQFIPFEILGGEQEDVVGLCQPPGTIREVRRVAQHRHCARTECKQAQPNDRFVTDWTVRPVFAFGDDVIMRLVAKLFTASDDIGFQGDDVLLTLGDVSPRFESLGELLFEPLALTLAATGGGVFVDVFFVGTTHGGPPGWSTARVGV